MHAEVASYLNQPFEMTGGTGSYIFMAGEIFRHEPYNTKADMYSFAMIMYQMLTGTRPFAGLEPVSAAMRASVDGLRPEWPATHPQHYSADDCAALGKVQGLVERCWAGSPLDRCDLFFFCF
jgi:serine/threonine protein kinase